MWRKNHLIAIGEMVGDEVVKERPFKTRAEVGVNPGAGARDLRGSLVVDKTAGFAKGDMVFRGEAKFWFLAIDIEWLVVFFSAGCKVWIWEVWKNLDQALEFSFDGLESLFARLGSGAELFDFGEDGFDVSAFLFDGRDGGGKSILLRFGGFDFL